MRYPSHAAQPPTDHMLDLRRKVAMPLMCCPAYGAAQFEYAPTFPW